MKDTIKKLTIDKVTVKKLARVRSGVRAGGTETETTETCYGCTLSCQGSVHTKQY